MEEVVLVDTSDQEVGRMEKLKAHRQGLLHRAFSVFLFNNRGETLIHKRAADKYHSGGLWANSCDGHPRPGETTLDSARRRLSEELGIDCPLYARDHFIYRVRLDHDLLEHEFLHVLTGTWSSAVQPDPNEISELRWLSIDSLSSEIQQNEANYCYWTRIAIARLPHGSAPSR